MDSASNNKLSVFARVIQILLLGVLSMFMAEVYAGSSQIWFIDTWSLTMTLWLYLFHCLFFLNVAFRTKRMSLPQLYLWGMLFGLYEGPITKVLFFGYPGTSGAAWGLVAGIAINEFLTLVFFWHPVMAFVLPVYIYEVFALQGNPNSQNVISSHLPALQWNKTNKRLLFAITFIGSLMLSLNTQFTGITAIIAAVGSIAIVTLFKLLAGQKLTIKSLHFRTGGMILVLIYLIGLYTITWNWLNADKLPTLETWLIIIGIIITIIILIFITSPQKEQGDSLMVEQNPVIQSQNIDPSKISEPKLESSMVIQAKHIYILWGTFVGLLILWAALPIVAAIIATVIFVGIPAIGVIIFIVCLTRVFSKSFK